MQQRRLIDARRIVQKLVVSAAMTPNPAIGPRTISVPRRQGWQRQGPGVAQAPGKILFGVHAQPWLPALGAPGLLRCSCCSAAQGRRRVVLHHGSPGHASCASQCERHGKHSI